MVIRRHPYMGSRWLRTERMERIELMVRVAMAPPYVMGSRTRILTRFNNGQGNTRHLLVQQEHVFRVHTGCFGRYRFIRSNTYCISPSAPIVGSVHPNAKV